MASENQTFSAKWSAKWTESVTNILVNLLVDEVKKGNRTSSTYNKAGWKNIQTEFIKQTGFQYSMVQLKNKVNKLRKQYGSFKKLISQSGFGWDNVKKTVTVDDPSIWESHIKDNVDWAKFKKHGFPQYPKLCIVFDGKYASGDCTNVEDLTMSEENDNGGGNADGDNGGGNTDDFSEYHIDERVFTSDSAPTKRRRSNQSERISNQSAIADTCKAIQDYFKARASQFVSGSATSVVTPPPVDPFSISAMMDVLLSMDGLEQDLYNKAVERACDSAPWREAFIKSSPERRIGLLQ